MAFTEGQREAVQIWQRASKLDGGDDVTFNQLKAVLDATNYFDLRKAAEKAIAACPMNCENGLLIDTEGREYHCCCCYDLRAALKGGGGE